MAEAAAAAARGLVAVGALGLGAGPVRWFAICSKRFCARPFSCARPLRKASNAASLSPPRWLRKVGPGWRERPGGGWGRSCSTACVRSDKAVPSPQRERVGAIYKLHHSDTWASALYLRQWLVIPRTQRPGSPPLHRGGSGDSDQEARRLRRPQLQGNAEASGVAMHHRDEVSHAQGAWLLTLEETRV
jgi:hypothetical protein